MGAPLNNVTSDSVVDSTDDAGWDSAVFGTRLRDDLLKGFSSSVSQLNSDSLSPLQQALIAGRLSDQAIKELHSASLANAPVLAHLIPAKGVATEGGESEGFAWMPLTKLSVQSIDTRLEVQIARLIDACRPGSTISGRPLERLVHLVFHPLQNVWQHAREASRSGNAGGIAVRLVNEITPLTPSVKEYLSAHRLATDTRFLELVLFDDGDGVALHFHRYSRQRDNQPVDDIYSGPVEREWLILKTAFERHSTSKHFQWSVSQSPNDKAFAPGIGLAAMINMTRVLNTYFEIRCGRLRLYRWFEPGERVMAHQLTLPKTPPRAAEVVRGTLIRFLVPISLL
jgi:hypothetical protein